MNYAKMTNFNGMPCVDISAGGYSALIAYEIGSNVIRLRNNEKAVEFFRFNDNNSPQELLQSAEVWGHPTLYLPNRFADGILKTSDAEYILPMNEKNHYRTHIHGFLHKRVHVVEEYGYDDVAAWAKTSYLYDNRDSFFQYLPIKFKAEYNFRLSENGLEQTIKLTNLSGNKAMPISLGSHTSIKAPFVDNAKPADIRLTVPIEERCELSERCMPTERLLPLSEWDKDYKNGKMIPVLQGLDNDMYTGGFAELDGKPFHGAIMEDTASGIKLCYEVSEEYKFWDIWNDRGFNGYFCPEPMTAMINAPNLSLTREISGYDEIMPGESFECRQRFFVK